MKTTNSLLAIIAVLLLMNLVNKSWFITEANAQSTFQKINSNVLDVRIVGVGQGVNIPVTSSLDENGKVQPLGTVVLNKEYGGIYVPVLQVNK